MRSRMSCHSRDNSTTVRSITSSDSDRDVEAKSLTLNFRSNDLGVRLAWLSRFCGGFRALVALSFLLQILPPRKVNQDEIEDREQHEKNRMRVCVTMHLVYAK